VRGGEEGSDEVGGDEDDEVVAIVVVVGLNCRPVAKVRMAFLNLG
jgi:hypothetical protein